MVGLESMDFGSGRQLRKYDGSGAVINMLPQTCKVAPTFKKDTRYCCRKVVTFWCRSCGKELTNVYMFRKLTQSLKRIVAKVTVFYIVNQSCQKAHVWIWRKLRIPGREWVVLKATPLPPLQPDLKKYVIFGNLIHKGKFYASGDLRIEHVQETRSCSPAQSHLDGCRSVWIHRICGLLRRSWRQGQRVRTEQPNQSWHDHWNA